MENKDYAKIISKNLKRVMVEYDRTQAQLSRDLHIPKTTLSGWMNGTRCPKMKSIDMLCRYFGVSRSDLTEEKTGFYAKSTNPAESGDINTMFAALNGTGQQMALEYMRFLLADNRYKKSVTASA